MRKHTLYVAYVPAEQIEVEFDPALHCDEALDGFGFEAEQTEGLVADLMIRREQTGWSLLRDNKRGVLVSYSPTGRREDAVLMFRGLIRSLPENLGGTEQTIRASCAPRDVNKRLIDYVRSNLDVRPFVDHLAADFSRDRAESYLAGYSGTLRVDPASFAISLVDDISGVRIVDMSDEALVDGGTETKLGVYGAPLKRMRAKVQVSWTQSFAGSMDAASWIKSFTSLDGQIKDLGGILVLEQGEGWTFNGSLSKIRRQFAGTQKFEGISLYDVHSDDWEVVDVPTRTLENGNPIWTDPIRKVATRKPDAVSNVNTTSLSCELQRYRYVVDNMTFDFQYSQDRQETLYVRMECQIPDAVDFSYEDPLESGDASDDDPGEDGDGSFIEVSLGDLFKDAGFPDWEINEDYVKGDVVFYNGSYYRCLADHHSRFFAQPPAKPILGPFLPNGDNYRYPTNWVRTFPDGILSPETLDTFFGTSRGRMFVEHVGKRLRKALLRRMRAYHVVARFRWQDAWHLRTDDSVKMTVDYDGESGRTIVGRVYSLKWSWDAEGGPEIVAEIAICLGTGGLPDVYVPDEEARYVEEDFVEEGYFADGASRLSDTSITIIGAPKTGGSLVASLSQPGGGVFFAEVLNQASSQALAVFDLDGKPIEEVSVSKPTAIRMAMRDIAPKATTMRDVDAVMFLRYSPQGIVI